MGQSQRGRLAGLRAVRVVAAEVDFTQQPFEQPLVLSGGTISRITEATAQVHVRIGTYDAVGRGCIYLSDLWAWPDAALTHEQRDAAMRQYCQMLATALPGICGEPASPISLGLRLHEAINRPSDDPAVPPPLARAVCSSIFDAAIHDAAGRALGRSALSFYEETYPIPEADRWFDDVVDGATQNANSRRGAFEGQCCQAIAALLSGSPRRQSPAWYAVSGDGDLRERIAPVVKQYGIFAFKLKIKGKDACYDAQRTAELGQAARSLGVAKPRISVDSNEGNPDARSVLDYLDALASMSEDTYNALVLLEQPTGRDLTEHAFDWQPVARRKPVLVDEGLQSFDAMEIARQQGWSGFALKTCKGHSFTLAAAAWAARQRMLLSLQDLTNPGIAAIHSGLLAGHLSTINGVELNAWQFTPNANEPWLPRLASLFEPHGGRIELPPAETIGLGSDL